MGRVFWLVGKLKQLGKGSLPSEKSLRVLPGVGRRSHLLLARTGREGLACQSQRAVPAIAYQKPIPINILKAYPTLTKMQRIQQCQITVLDSPHSFHFQSPHHKLCCFGVRGVSIEVFSG